MEDMARLALVEQSVGNPDTFRNILYKLLRHINQVLENPHDLRLRTITSMVLKKALELDAFVDYLKSIGFQASGNNYVYPKESTLNNLRVAQAAVERKIYFCCGPLDQKRLKACTVRSLLAAPKRTTLMPARVLRTINPLLNRIERMFNGMLRYESEDLLEAARELIPVVTLQLMALDRLREHQRKLKAGEIQGRDMAFDTALLMELMGWFKHSFFSWVDCPPCTRCGEATERRGDTTVRTPTEMCHVELYKCKSCLHGKAKFFRYNDPRTLLRTRRGRCGEWANCFALMCLALGFETRTVCDNADHVWCEVFDIDTNAWIHVDPCEGILNAPLTYSHGWKKQLSYVFAVSREDLQDVTWKYTTDHKEVLKRRTSCSEAELLKAILSLRDIRQSYISEARKAYLAKRNLQELVQMLVERKPGDYECHGRISGSAEWRRARGEAGAADAGAPAAPPPGGFTFRLERRGRHTLTYSVAGDRYRTERVRREGWASSVFACARVFRKLERDWRMVYLAREEGSDIGHISWRIEAAAPYHRIMAITIRAVVMLYESGAVHWTLSFDGGQPIRVTVTDTPTEFRQPCRSVVLAAELRGGAGAEAWQHAQLFRQHIDSKEDALEISAFVE